MRILATSSSSPIHRLAGALLTAVLLLSAVPASGHEETAETIQQFVHHLEEAGDITAAQHQVIDRLAFGLDKHDQLRHWLDAQFQAGELTENTYLYLEALLHLYHREEPAVPAPADYSGNGTVTKLGQINVQPPGSGQIYNGIWGHATGVREYALQTNSFGLHIIDITSPANPFRVQFIDMSGGFNPPLGRIWRDPDTHLDLPSGKTYAYIGAQSGGHLWVVDLSYLSPTIPHGVDSDPIPPTGIADRGRADYGHTIFINDGLLFMNSANNNSTLGCQIFDLLQDPFDPPLIASWSGSQRDCHDSYARSNVPGSGGKDLLYSSDGYARRYRLLDITTVRSGGTPTLLSETPLVSGTYAHSDWLSDDSQHLYVFEEFNQYDLGVYDVSDPLNPALVTTFQYSEDSTANARVHNGQVRGDYLFVAYYEAGLRVFDISNPANPVEVGKLETWRDPDGDGTFNESITGAYDGAWNVHAFLPSGAVLISDTRSGTFIVESSPVAVPPPPVLAATPGDAQVSLSWTAVPGSTGYSLHRGTASGGPYQQIAAQIVGTDHTDTGLANGTNYFYVARASNAEGESAGSNQTEATPFAATVCGDGVCELGEDCDTCLADCPSFEISAASCGNGLCEAADGEDCVTCAADCAGRQKGRPQNRFCCGFGGTNPLGCGSEACTTGGWSCTETPAGSSGLTCCGDLSCQDPEDVFNCSLDCGAPPFCGDSTCDFDEDVCSCSGDCGLPAVSESGSCTDGQDNDCDLDIDCTDSDCQADPACQPVDCSSIDKRRLCRSEPSCQWDNLARVCEASG